MPFSITIDSAQVVNGQLNVSYTRNGNSSGHGVSWPTNRLADFEIKEDELEEFILRAILTWSRRRGLTAAQIVGKVVTIDPGVIRNLITVV